jgi:hypothetical protein
MAKERGGERGERRRERRERRRSEVGQRLWLRLRLKQGGDERFGWEGDVTLN